MTAWPSLNKPFGIRRVSRADVSQNLLGNLTMQRIWWNRKIQHAWQLPWSVLIAADKSTLLTFFETCRGRILGDISFTCPFDSVAYTVRLDQDELVLSNAPMPHWNGTLTLVECASFKALKSPVDPFPATVPFQVLTNSERYNTVVEAQQDNSELRYEDWSASIRRWTVGGDALTTSQAQALVDAWEGNGGPYKGFTFTDPDTSTAYDAHFVETELSVISVTLGVWSCKATVEQLVSPPA